MRLFEAIIDANHRAAAGDQGAGLRVSEHEDELPIVALTCIDPRLNRLMPEVLGVPEEQFIWLRNAGNIITSPLSSTMRSMALACAIKGGKEVAIIGHTDCQVSKVTGFSVLERLRQMGVERHVLPDNLNEFFGMFGSERANVLKAVGFVRSSPLIGSRIPVHGLLVDTDTGKLEWIVNGYESFAQNALRIGEQIGGPIGHATDLLQNIKDFSLGDIKFPDIKIGEVAARIQELPIFQKDKEPTARVSTQPQPAPSPAPPKIPLPPPTKPKLSFRRAPK